MSRIGKKPVPVGAAKVSVNGQVVNFEGPKGKLTLTGHPTIKVALDAAKKELVVTRPDDEKPSKALLNSTGQAKKRQLSEPRPADTENDEARPEQDEARRFIGVLQIVDALATVVRDMGMFSYSVGGAWGSFRVRNDLM